MQLESKWVRQRMKAVQEWHPISKKNENKTNPIEIYLGAWCIQLKLNIVDLSNSISCHTSNQKHSMTCDPNVQRHGPRNDI